MVTVFEPMLAMESIIANPQTIAKIDENGTKITAFDLNSLGIVYNSQLDPQFSKIESTLSEHPVNNDHLLNNGHFFESQGWPFYTGLTVIKFIQIDKLEITLSYVMYV
jgi:hypothetical protein